MAGRGFATQEYESRVDRAQKMMAGAGLDALLLTIEPDVRYVTGFLTRFWESPTRPWFVVLPASSTPIAIIPAIGAHLMQQCWITDIRTWRAPDYEDDGVSQVIAVLREVVPENGSVGVPSGLETHMRMPRQSWDTICTGLTGRTVRDDANIMRNLRLVKSDAEITKITAACAIANRAFARVPEIATCGKPIAQVFREFQMLCLEEGADWVSYLAGSAGPGGYGDVISPATERPLQSGDVLMLDTGLVRDGYFCDFDRNWSMGPPSDETGAAYARLITASDAAFDAARPGVTARDLFHTMDAILTGGAGGSDAGRLGHGLGIQLTEWPSLIPADQTILEPGMVLTLEPGIEIAPGRTLVHEENIVITQNGARYLSQPAARTLPVIEAGT